MAPPSLTTQMSSAEVPEMPVKAGGDGQSMPVGMTSQLLPSHRVTSPKPTAWRRDGSSPQSANRGSGAPESTTTQSLSGTVQRFCASQVAGGVQAPQSTDQAAPQLFAPVTWP